MFSEIHTSGIKGIRTAFEKFKRHSFGCAAFLWKNAGSYGIIKKIFEKR
jgi:hypothetical protein